MTAAPPVEIDWQTAHGQAFGEPYTLQRAEVWPRRGGLPIELSIEVEADGGAYWDIRRGDWLWASGGPTTVDDAETELARRLPAVLARIDGGTL